MQHKKLTTDSKIASPDRQKISLCVTSDLTLYVHTFTLHFIVLLLSGVVVNVLQCLTVIVLVF